jgi:hypothetical protein
MEGLKFLPYPVAGLIKTGDGPEAISTRSFFDTFLA